MVKQKGAKRHPASLKAKIVAECKAGARKEDVAAKYGVGRSAVYRWVQEAGEGKASKPGLVKTVPKAVPAPTIVLSQDESVEALVRAVEVILQYVALLERQRNKLNQVIEALKDTSCH